MLLALIPVVCFAKDASRIKPLFVMIERDAETGVFRCEPPRFVLYSNGMVLYTEPYESGSYGKGAPKYYKIQLNDSEFTELKSIVSDTTAISKLKKQYTFAGWRKPFFTQEFGWLGEGGKLTCRYFFGNTKNRFNTEFSELSFLFNIIKTIEKFKPAPQRRWLPEKIEVLLKPCMGTDKPFNWPAKWPGLSDPSSIHRNSTSKSSTTLRSNSSDYDNSVTEMMEREMPYSVFLSSQACDELVALPERESILIDGKHVSAMIYISIPCEEALKTVSAKNPWQEFVTKEMLLEDVWSDPNMSNDDTIDLRPLGSE
jgi:hypothetical protein